jgi:hypothetical protein
MIPIERPQPVLLQQQTQETIMEIYLPNQHVKQSVTNQSKTVP